MTTHATLLDSAVIMLQAGVLNDLESARKSIGSRHGALTGFTPDGKPWVDDKDGKVRIVGLEVDNPHVVRFASMFDALRQVEDTAVLNLERAMTQHPLGPWVKAQRGLGLKQAGRLLAAIGDPYWRRELNYKDDNDVVVRTVPEGPRTVSALWAYAGLHVVSGQATSGEQANPAGELGGDPGQDGSDPQTSAAGVAARRKKGVKANWSTEAKTRAYLCAESCAKQLVKPCAVSTVEGENWAIHMPDGCKCSPFRVKYDARKAHTAKSWPEESDGHRHNDALRVASKEILKHLWREARRLHIEFDPELGEANHGPMSREGAPR